MSQGVPGPGIGSEFGLSARGGYRLNWRASHYERSANYLFTANGRAALAAAASSARRAAASQQKVALLPAYLCHSMIQPFAEMGLSIRFYPVNEHLRINKSDITSRVDESLHVILVTHYFGFPQPDNLAEILAEQFPSIIVIDDRTHLLLTDLYSGQSTAPRNSIAVYSPRKWGPFPDIGIVVWPQNAHSRIEVTGYDLTFALWRTLGLLARAVYFTWPIDSVRRFSLRLVQRGDAVLDRRVQIARASPISCLLWRVWDWASAWCARREHYRYLLDQWPSAAIRPMFGDLPASVCPIGFPVRAPERDRLKQHLISNKIFPPIHWVRPEQVPPDEFPDAAALAEQELTIPIDQRYNLRLMDYILETVCHA